MAKYLSLMRFGDKTTKLQVEIKLNLLNYESHLKFGRGCEVRTRDKCIKS